MHARAGAALALGLTVAMLVSGCGDRQQDADQATTVAASPKVATPSPDRLLSKVEERIADLDTARVTVAGYQDGSVLRVQVDGDAAGTYADGTMRYQGDSVRFRVVAGQVYLSGSGQLADYFTAGNAPGDNWVTAPPANAPVFLDYTVPKLLNLAPATEPAGLPAAQLSPGVDATLATEAAPSSAVPDPITGTPGDRVVMDGSAVEVVQFRGQPAFRLLCDQFGRTVPVLVSAEGRWRLLAIGDLETDPQTTMLTFTRWNKGSPVAAPAPEDVIG